jgi:hypothetical protein
MFIVQQLEAILNNPQELLQKSRIKRKLPQNDYDLNYH